MKTFYPLLIIVSTFLYSCKQKNDSCNITIELEKIKYDSISMFFQLESDSIYKCKGVSKNGYTWNFSYPDSIGNQYKDISLYVRAGNNAVVRRILLSYIDGKDTLSVGNFRFNIPLSQIKTKYYNSDTIFNREAFDTKTNEIIKVTFIKDRYLIVSDTDKELLSSLEGMTKGYCMFEGTYEENFSKYIYLAKKYPDSHYLMLELSSSLTRIKSNTDITQLYNCFTETNRQSYYGKKINEYLKNSVFINSKLPTWDTGIIEPILQDTSKFNLVVFSASWCQPCHKAIPILKEIYNDLGNKLVITYISTDEAETASNWKELMKKENIQWRSLLATSCLNEIKEKYTVQGIPYMLLVHPNSMHKEIIDIRDENDKTRLYQLIN